MQAKHQKNKITIRITIIIEKRYENRIKFELAPLDNSNIEIEI